MSVIAALAVLLGCRKETIDKPDAPSMADVVASFDAPSGTFDSSTSASVRSAIDRAESGLVGAGVTDRLFAAIDDAITKAHSSDKSQTKTTTTTTLATATAGATAAAPAPTLGPRSTFEDSGFARLTRICDGWGPEPTPDDAANGHLTLTFGFDQNRIDPVIWGDAERCLYLLGAKRLKLDRGAAPDSLRLYVGENATIDALRTTPVILALDLLATLDDQPVDAKLAIRFVYAASQVELLVPVTDGSVVVTISGGSPLGVRAKNGTFACDVTTLRCKGSGGGEVTL